MQKKKENFRPLRSVTTFALAAAIITGSIYTVAAAVHYSAETEQAVTSDGVELAKEYHLPSIKNSFILQHHGEGLAKYFYNQADQEEGIEYVK